MPRLVPGADGGAVGIGIEHIGLHECAVAEAEVRCCHGSAFSTNGNKRNNRKKYVICQGNFLQFAGVCTKRRPAALFFREIAGPMVNADTSYIQSCRTPSFYGSN